MHEMHDRLDDLERLVETVNRGFVSPARRRRAREAIGKIIRETRIVVDEAEVARIDATHAGRMFDAMIPIDRPGESSRTRSTNRSSFSSESVEVFGLRIPAGRFYPGTVFCHRHLSDGKTAFLLSWVAGVGFPAVVLQTAVIAQFETVYPRWGDDPETSLSQFRLDVNALLGKMHPNGRFAATMAGLIDADTGRMYIINAGMDRLTILRQSSSTVEQVRLPECPALGVFPSDMIPSSDRKAFGIALAPGDTVLLEGGRIEESTRASGPELAWSGNPRSVEWTEPSGAVNDATEQAGTDEYTEAFRSDRIDKLLQALLARRTYETARFHNEVPDERLVFDFSKVDPGPRTTVLALAAAEQVFRLVTPEARGTSAPGSDAGSVDYTDIDLDVLDFLEKTFNGYDRYFAHPVPTASAGQTESVSPPYRRFAHLRSHPQHDTIAVLAITRKGASRQETNPDESSEASVRQTAEEPGSQDRTPDHPSVPDDAPTEVEYFDEDIEELEAFDDKTD